MKKVLDILKIISLLLISILITIMIVQKAIPEKTNNIKTYMDWCSRLDGGKYNPDYYKKNIIYCVKEWKKIEKKVK